MSKLNSAARPFMFTRRGSAAGAALAALGLGASAAYLKKRLDHIPAHSPEALRQLRAGATNPLFESYPALRDRIPWRPIGTFPTPIEELAPLPDAPNVRLLVKRDDLSSGLYGGNKVRKLELFLAEAELLGRRTLITLGGIGSNHALATASHGETLGFDVDLALYDQPTTPAVRRNLGGFLAAGARLHDAGSIARAFGTAARLYRRHKLEGGKPYFIMVGGTSRLGCIAHVNAALELGRQIRDGALPEPESLFVPLGTCGTAAGLITGLKLAGLRTRVAAVRVADPFPANPAILRYFAQDTADFLHASDPSVPRVRISRDDFDVVTHHYGEGYGVPTAAGEKAVGWAAPKLALETTYSGKALAACLEYCASCAQPASVLFWNTFNSAPVASPERWSALPAQLRHLAPDLS